MKDWGAHTQLVRYTCMKFDLPVMGFEKSEILLFLCGVVICSCLSTHPSINIPLSLLTQTLFVLKSLFCTSYCCVETLWWINFHYFYGHCDILPQKFIWVRKYFLFMKCSKVNTDNTREHFYVAKQYMCHRVMNCYDEVVLRHKQLRPYRQIKPVDQYY